MNTEKPSLDDLQLFCAVARERSFTRVSETVGIPLATLSRRVASLERQLDAQLLRRSTRRVDPTDAGVLLLERAERPLRDLDEALDCLAEETGTPRGRLRVTMPADLARYWLATPLATFASRHPEIRLELDLSSRVVDLLAEGFDLAIRASRPADASLIARRLANMPTALYASPSYLAGLPPLRHPRDLGAANALVITGRSSDRSWTLRHGRERVTVTPHGNVEVNDMTALIGIAAAGAGIALLPEPKVGEQAAEGALTRVLPAWSGPEAPIYAVYASRRMPLRLRLFLDHLREWTAQGPRAAGTSHSQVRTDSPR
jgi:DNA-binding transcriptional LysR family regulator